MGRMQGPGAGRIIAGMAATMKQCPRCAEMVVAEARACRFCGYDPETLAAQRARSADRQVTLGLAVALIVFLAATALFVAIWVW